MYIPDIVRSYPKMSILWTRTYYDTYKTGPVGTITSLPSLKTIPIECDSHDFAPNYSALPLKPQLN